MDKGERFNYVIARRWYDDSNQLDCYAYHSTVFHGDIHDARYMLEFIKGRADKDKADQYGIYKIGDEPLK